MADIKLDKAEMALWNEVGERGEQFRLATRERAAEEMRLQKHMIEVVDQDGSMVDSVALSDPDPESPAKPADTPPEEK